MTTLRNPSQLEELWHKHAKALTRYATRMLWDWSAAEAVTQDAFLRWMEAGTEVSQENARAWLYKVVRNKSIDLLRRDKRLKELNERVAKPIADASSEPVAQTLEKEEETMLNDQIAELPKRQREVLRLKFQENLSYREIAQTTGDTVAMVGQLLHQALGTLRKRVAT